MKNKTKRFIAFSLLHFFLNGLIFTTIFVSLESDLKISVFVKEEKK